MRPITTPRPACRCRAVMPWLAAALSASCALPPAAPPQAGAGRAVTIQRTAYGVPHVSAPDLESLAYGVAYAHAQDNVCQTAQQLVTVRGERSRWFGPAATALLGRRVLANGVIDAFIAAHMDDAALARAWQATSTEAQAMARGYVAGYNRYLGDHADRLPAACRGQAWVTPMSERDYARLGEALVTQAASVALADAVVGAQPPAAGTAAGALPTLAAVEQALRDRGLLDPPLGSNAWAFGRDTTADRGGLLLGNPHFPWAGINRFWQMHVTVPGQVDSMGAATGHSPLPSIGFNKDVAWSHTVSTGKRFTLHELKLVPGDPTAYLLDDKPVKMRSRTVSVSERGGDGQLSMRTRTLWSTHWGPVIVLPAAGLGWSATTAYALKDANAGNARFMDSWLAINRARDLKALRDAHGNLGIPWVNTVAAGREGLAMYADLSVVPDVDAEQLARCAPGARAAALLRGPGLVVLDGSRTACDWRRDPASPVPGLTAPGRMPVALRADWVHNSNDSFAYTHPAQRWEGIPPLVGDDIVRRPRTRAGLIEIPELLARGPVTARRVQEQLFANRNTMAQMVLPDLLRACEAGAPTADATEACKVLRAWDRSNNLEARGAHLFREFWRAAMAVPGVYRLPFDKAQPVATPAGLKMDDAAVAAKVWDALDGAVKKVRAAGFRLDSPLGSVQWSLVTERPIAVHGGDEFEGVLNNVGNQFAPGIGPQGLRIDYGSSYIQTVGFDERGPVAQGILTYGQSTDPASPHAVDQLRLYSLKQWPALPFHPEDVERARVGRVIRLILP